jgi:predicted TIM-barrel fold metal-dependent hydrolase
MIDEAFVIDAISHCLDYSAVNCVPGAGEPLQDLVVDVHLNWNAPDQVLDREHLLMEMAPETMARTLFLESDLDMAVTHHLPTYSFFSKGLTTRDQNEELVRRWPQRFIGYAGVDPTQGIDVAIRQLEDQMESCPTLVGLKLYPAAVNPYRYFMLDDEEMFPLYRRALELGLKVVAVHKAIPLGPVPLASYKVHDVDTAAFNFPDLNFEIVHAGMAFAEETAIPLAQFPNVYANLEITTGWLSAPHGPKGRFYDVLGMFLQWGGLEKIFFATTAMVLHPQRVIRSIWDLELPQDVLDKFGLEQLTREDKARLLGRNYADMLGLDLDALKRGIEGDEFDVERRERPPVEPWGAWRAQYEREHHKPELAPAR